uniref:Integrase catalytic domain-containing protein n=1 Tax=Nicotiana tabacum TaxID=4097 RepID=A0A1S3ZC98_TOBAC|nr:PREDICTED: uncharacterized protein LOC107785320 [Nicotiana tabacum]
MKIWVGYPRTDMKEHRKKNRKGKWYLGSVCSRHMTCDKQLFKSVTKLNGGSVTFGDKSKGNIIGIGRVPLSSSCDVDEFYLVDEFGYNLLSISQLYDSDYEVHREKGYYISAIRSDHGGEFESRAFENFCIDQGISHNLSSPRSLQQNGVVEWKNRTLKDMARTMIVENAFSHHFWAEAVSTACHIVNRCLMRPILKKLHMSYGIVKYPTSVTFIYLAANAFSTIMERKTLESPTIEQSTPIEKESVSAIPNEWKSELDEALKDDNWVKAMKEEPDQFERDKVWNLVPKPSDASIVGTKWVFRNKLNESGQVVHKKARLVTQGYSQQEGIDYDETFAPVERLESI